MSLLATLILLPVISADDPVFSGPQPGEPLTPFVIQSAGGSADGKLDIVDEADGKPVVLAFVHERTRPSFGLANAVMKLAENRGPAKIVGGLIYLNEDPTEAVTWMNRVKGYFPQKVLKGVSVDGKEGPGAYGLNRNVALTILVAKDNKVTANFALVQPSMEVDAPKIFRAIADVLGEKETPTVEDVNRMANAGRNQRMRARPSDRQPTRQDPAIRPLLAAVIRKDAPDADVDKAAKKVEDFAAENPAAGQQIGDIARRIIAAGRLKSYGTARSQEYLTKWSKEFDSSKPAKQSTDAASPNEQR